MFQFEVNRVGENTASNRDLYTIARLPPGPSTLRSRRFRKLRRVTLPSFASSKCNNRRPFSRNCSSRVRRLRVPRSADGDAILCVATRCTIASPKCTESGLAGPRTTAYTRAHAHAHTRERVRPVTVHGEKNLMVFFSGALNSPFLATSYAAIANEREGTTKEKKRTENCQPRCPNSEIATIETRDQLRRRIVFVP